MNDTIQFPAFRSAAEFYANAGWTYDEACEIVRNLMNDGKLVIQKTKTDWSLLGEWAFFSVGMFVGVAGYIAMCAWIQIETACQTWMLASLVIPLFVAWMWHAIVSAKIMLVDTIRNI